LQIPNMSKSKRQKPDQCALSSTARPPNNYLRFFQTNQRRRRPIRPAARLSAAGEGVSTATNKHPQPLFHKNIKKDAAPREIALFSWVCH
ncbi:MAG: hypothetical protein VXY73_00410, partial [Pseudomonadota bacterium]|nr:hypothetical protein [Pseudomonadota bacterium]